MRRSLTLILSALILAACSLGSDSSTPTTEREYQELMTATPRPTSTPFPTATSLPRATNPPAPSTEENPARSTSTPKLIPTPTPVEARDNDAIFEIWKHPPTTPTFDLDGFELVRRVGTPTTPNMPAATLPLPDRTVLVADAGLGRIIQFDQEGAPLGYWGGTETWDLWDGLPIRLALDPQGNVYVLTTMGNIHRFYLDGRHDHTFGSSEFLGQFTYSDDLTALAVDSHGNIYIGMLSSGDSSFAARLSPDGNPTGSWQFDAECSSGSLAIGPDDSTYASCSDGIYLFDDDGPPRQVWSSPEVDGRQTSVRSIAVLPDGSLAALLTGGYERDVDGNSIAFDWLVMHLDRSGSELERWTVPPLERLSYGTFPAIAVDAQSRIYVALSQEQQVAIFSPSGALLAEIKDDRVGTLARLDRLAIDGDGNVYGLDLANEHVVKFSPEGELTAVIPIPTYSPYTHNGADQLIGDLPDLGVGPNGDLYLAVQIPGLLVRFSQQGDLIEITELKLGLLGSPHSPTSLAFDSSGTAYTLDDNGGDVEMVGGEAGRMLGEWDVELSYKEYHIGGDIWINGETVYLTGWESVEGQQEDDLPSLHRFDLYGRDLGRIVAFLGHPLSGEGPVWVAADDLGNVYTVTWRLSASDPVTQPEYGGQPVSEMMFRAFTPEGELFGSGFLGLPSNAFPDLVVSADGQRLYISDPAGRQLLIYERTP